MATGYNIILPNGSVWKVKYSTDEDRERIVDELLKRWTPYCLSNWCSANADTPYSPENKVKMFLSSLGYFLLSGKTDGVVTYYKDIMHGKREIPFSSCPNQIEDAAYSMTHNGAPMIEKAQAESFNSFVQNLDERSEKIFGKKIPRVRKHTQTRYDRIAATKSAYPTCSIHRAVVDTEGNFLFNGRQYAIDMKLCKKYAPKETDIGELYDMDYVVCVDAGGDVMFFDADFFRIDDNAVRCVSGKNP